MTLFKKWKNLKERVRKAEETTIATNEKVNHLEEMMEQVLKNALVKAQKYDEQVKNLRSMKISLESVKKVLNPETYDYDLVVKYKIEDIKLSFDSTSGKMIANDLERFRAMNLLGVISNEELMQVAKVVRDIEDLNLKNK